MVPGLFDSLTRIHKQIKSVKRTKLCPSVRPEKISECLKFVTDGKIRPFWWTSVCVLHLWNRPNIEAIRQFKLDRIIRVVRIDNGFFYQWFWTIFRQFHEQSNHLSYCWLLFYYLCDFVQNMRRKMKFWWFKSHDAMMNKIEIR